MSPTLSLTDASLILLVAIPILYFAILGVQCHGQKIVRYTSAFLIVISLVAIFTTCTLVGMDLGLIERAGVNLYSCPIPGAS